MRTEAIVSVDKVTGAIRIAANAQQNSTVVCSKRVATRSEPRRRGAQQQHATGRGEIASETGVSTLEYVWGRKNEAGYRGKGAADFGWGGVFG